MRGGGDVPLPLPQGLRWSPSAGDAPVARPPPARCPARRQSGYACPRLSISRGAIRLWGEGDRMRIFWGWVIVGVGFVVACIGMGAQLSLGVFLPRLTEAM